MLGVNDYPYRATCPGSCGLETACGAGGIWARCNCTSFACWRLQNDIGGPHLTGAFGDATTWAQAARGLGIAVDGRPAVGAIYQLPAGINGAGNAGHVAVVLEVGPSAHARAGWVWVEDYDWNLGSGFCRYNQHAVPVAGANFLHFHDRGSTQCQGCTACQQCVGGQCVPLTCPAGTACVNGHCLPPAPPPPVVAATLLPLGVLAGGAAAAWWYGRSHGQAFGGRGFGGAGRQARAARRPATWTAGGHGFAGSSRLERRHARVPEHGFSRSRLP